MVVLPEGRVMELPLAPDYWPSYEDRLATANELVRLAELYLESGDSFRAAMTLSVAEDVIEALIHEPDSAKRSPERTGD